MAEKSQQQSRLKELIARGKEQGYLTYADQLAGPGGRHHCDDQRHRHQSV
jgi:hypothetical protein